MNRLTSLFCLLLLILSIPGCGSGGAETASPGDSNLAKLGRLYSLCGARGVPPADEQALRDYVSELPKVDFKGDLDKLFISERDEQPYVMFYGKDAKQGANGTVIGHEAVGVDGKFYLCYSDGMVEEVDEAAIKALK